MNREEAINVLENPDVSIGVAARIGQDPEYWRKLKPALDMAISALRQEKTVTERHELNDPLTLDELRKMDAPVWLRCYQVDGDGYWCLCKNGIIITPAGNRYDVSEIPHWAFYRQKPEEG